jgi:hypothetical protein
MTDKIQENFLKTYNDCADDIFNYCLERTSDRNSAKYLTRAIFAETWDTISKTNSNVRDIKKELYRETHDRIKEIEVNQKDHAYFSDNLWNLTLAQ